MKKLKNIIVKDTEVFNLYDYKNLNNLIGGIKRGELITIGARVGCGKTTLGLNILCDLVCGYKKVLFCSFEMNEQEILNKINKVYDLSEDALNDFFIEDDASKMDINWLESQIKKYNFDVICIDYVQIMNGSIKTLTKQLKALALKYNVVIICLAQLNRQAENKAPQLSMLKDSGTIEQDSDEVWFITQWKLIVAKNRKGRIGSINIIFHKEKSWIEDTNARVEALGTLAKECIELLKKKKTREDGKKILFNIIRYQDVDLFTEISNALIDMIRNETPTKFNYILTQII